MPSEDSKPVKRVEENNKSSVSRKGTSSNVKPQSKVAKFKKEEPNTAGSRSKEPKFKKEYNEDDDDDDKPLAKRTSNSKDVNKKKNIKEEEKKKVEQKKRERKVYDLPGQKRDPPEEKDPLRIFYETLYKQVPHSEMSQIWLMESGLLPKEVAMKIYQQKQKKGLQQKLTSPVKAATAMKSSTKSVTVKKKSRTSPVSSVKTKITNATSKLSKKRKSADISSEDYSDDEFILAPSKRSKAA
ncbi:uncharacterized protein LOC133315648 [Gastrolobium bilobum]|uniref:uncharacterized protein LOC133315648 n=1 Tax=Gastrolobium bilobum TaxID=150636 RepID=UPI002AB1C25F|nr:uncharacterized protein LOC133315648 [Gastrolobium bilobum]